MDSSFFKKFFLSQLYDRDYASLRKFLFLLPPEIAHVVSLQLLKVAYYAKWLPPLETIDKNLGGEQNVHLMDLTFPNRVGLAAGLDKNGDYIEPLAALGFGFIEIGTVTPKPQSGNPKPRLFRLVEQQALINRMGFNNKGLDYVVSRLKISNYRGILGVNIGKNYDTPIEKAVDDYVKGFRAVAPYASYVTVNISSPNTPSLRDLQQGELLKTLLTTLKLEQKYQKKYVPLVLKISPDLTQEQLSELAETCCDVKIDGIIATNTTLQREGILNAESGGLSGKPLAARSTEVIRRLQGLLENKIPIIACGGIFSTEEANDKIKAGASLIQIYTGLIYEGPALIRRLAKSLQFFGVGE